MKATLHKDCSEVHVTLSETNLRKLVEAVESESWGRPFCFSVRDGQMDLDPPEPTIMIRVQPDEVHYFGSWENRFTSAMRNDDYAKEG